MFERGFTFVKDPRFTNKGAHWPLRIELIPVKDKKRNTRSFIVMKNEFGKKEWYPNFYRRMKELNCVYQNYSEIIEINKEGIWKEHPLRAQYKNNKLVSVPLKINLSKDEWEKSQQNKQYTKLRISRKLGKNYKLAKELVTEIIAEADEGQIEIEINHLRNWRIANPIQMNIESDQMVEEDMVVTTRN